MSQTENQSLIERIRTLDPGQAALELQDLPEDAVNAVLQELTEEQANQIKVQLADDGHSRGEDKMQSDVADGESDTVPSRQVQEAVSESAELINAIDGTVETLMSSPAAVLQRETTIAGALDFLVTTETESTITYIFVVDEKQHLAGVVTLRDLLLGSPGQSLGEVMTSNPYAFESETAIADAVRLSIKKRHRLFPVIDSEGKLVGQVYGWQLFELVALEISAQAGSMVGADKEERIDTPILRSFFMRHPWLQVNLLTAFCAAVVVAMFEDTITRIVALAAFLPVLAGQSGNTGCQALAITLRGMTLGDLIDYPIRKLLQKEIVLGAMNGFFVGLIAAAAMWYYAGSSGTENPFVLAVVILIAMVGACVGSGIFGVLVPVLLKRFGADPAMASSIFLTTFTDVLGMGLMLFLATSLLL